jgi:hypothetical protein
VTDLHEWRLSYECLPADDSSTTAFSRTNELPFMTRGEPTTEHYFEQFVYSSVPSVVSETCLPNRCPAMDHSASTRCHANVRQLRSNRALASGCQGYALSEAPSSNGPLRLSGVMSKYSTQNIKRVKSGSLKQFLSLMKHKEENRNGAMKYLQCCFHFSVIVIEFLNLHSIV